ncbi:alpha/beta hydrolase [Haliea sp. E1-2-M8]|uniref:alpha/beta fold hydrolase n=1 Tax=Haliea sp. E1-2-M8 TaxID=3064706 RepID=UPI00271E8994|nr:alpha/beta hydrolase [Haliea sp. E1-2-M8]MDO8864185.1 alpha/beta hydrolase [Haliea sp. E1-2-M8]
MPNPYIPSRGYADGPYGQIHFRDTGEGVPLVLLHQSPQTSKQFTSVYEVLNKLGVRAIGIDTPGFGESDPAPFVPTIQDWAVIVPAVLDHLGIHKAHVLGHHTGAMTATEVALQFPDRVQSVILNGPLPLNDKDRVEFLAGTEEREINFVYDSDGGHLKKSFETRFRMYGDSPDPETITRIVTEKFQGYAPFWIGHHAAFVYDHTEGIKRLTGPTLILTNTGDMIYDYAQMTRKMRPDFSYIELAGGGVDVVDQLTQQWSTAVSRWVLHDSHTMRNK